MPQNVAFIFPGQGSQVLGMGRSFYDTYQVAREVFQEVDDSLEYKLSDIIFGQDLSLLSATQNTQPALMTVSVAILKVLEKETKKSISDLCSVVAGHSLGEYSALVACGVMSLSDAAKVLKVRGNSMAVACPVGLGAMAAIIGADRQMVEKLIEISTQCNEILVFANDNSIGQIVISGHLSAVDRAIEKSSEVGIKRVIKLPVSGPFHSPLMNSAKDKVSYVLNDLHFANPLVRFVANVTAAFEDDPVKIKSLLVDQITSNVKWTQSIQLLEKNGINEFIEIGSGKVLSGLVKRTVQNVVTKNIENISDLEVFLS